MPGVSREERGTAFLALRPGRGMDNVTFQVIPQETLSLGALLPEDSTPAKPSLWLAPASQGGCVEGKDTWAGRASGLVTGELSREGTDATRNAREGEPTKTGEP